MATALKSIKKFVPLFDRVLVSRFEAEAASKGGILIPDKAKGKVLEAEVVATGPGARTESGSLIPVSVQPGDKVLLPEYGGTKITMEDREYFLFRDSDILGKFNE